MKSYILIAVAAVLVVGAGVLSVDHYHQYQNKKKAQEVSQVLVAKNAQYKADLGKITVLQAEVTRLNSECQKGSQAYALLPAVSKAKISSPICSASVAR